MISVKYHVVYLWDQSTTQTLFLCGQLNQNQPFDLEPLYVNPSFRYEL